MSTPSDQDTGREVTGIVETFAAYGWEITPEWVEKYNTDAWVYNLTNALVNERRRYLDVVALADRNALLYIEASNPGIDIEQVKAQRAAASGCSQTVDRTEPNTAGGGA